jgi:hypothetical protein
MEGAIQKPAHWVDGEWSMVTNFKKEDIELYQQSTLHTGGPILVIKDEAFDRDGKKVDGYKSLWVKGEVGGLWKFWVVHREMDARKKLGDPNWMNQQCW